MRSSFLLLKTIITLKRGSGSVTEACGDWEVMVRARLLTEKPGEEAKYQDSQAETVKSGQGLSNKLRVPGAGDGHGWVVIKFHKIVKIFQKCLLTSEVVPTQI